MEALETYRTLTPEMYHTPMCTVIPIAIHSTILDMSTQSLSQSSGAGWDDDDE